jgi:Protein of unknown function (DUF3775)
MLQALSPEQVQDVISLVNDLRAKNQAREKSGEEPSIEDILYSPERQKLAAYLLNLSVAARTELIALMLLGRGDEFKSYSTALAHSLKYLSTNSSPGNIRSIATVSLGYALPTSRNTQAGGALMFANGCSNPALSDRSVVRRSVDRRGRT